MIIAKFQEIKLTHEKQDRCAVCNKTAVRKITVSQTINPFNTNAKGRPKNAEEIRAELRQRIQAWLKLPVVHVKCGKKG